MNGALIGPLMPSRALATVGAALLWEQSRAYGPVLSAMVAGGVLLTFAFWAAAFLSRRGRDPLS